MNLVLNLSFRILLVLFLAGWLIPLWYSGNTFLTWAEAHEEQRVNSFPHLHYARMCLSISMIWGLAAMATLAWTWILPKHPKPKKTEFHIS